jgi:hypothetical protein
VQSVRTPNPDHQLNRASWDELAAVHGQDAYYDSAALVRGASSLTAEEDAALAKAQSLADRCGVDIEWVCADAIDLPRSLDGRIPCE